MITAVMVTVGYKVVSAVEWLMDRLLHLKEAKIPPTSRPLVQHLRRWAVFIPV